MKVPPQEICGQGGGGQLTLNFAASSAMGWTDSTLLFLTSSMASLRLLKIVSAFSNEKHMGGLMNRQLLSGPSTCGHRPPIVSLNSQQPAKGVNEHWPAPESYTRLWDGRKSSPPFLLQVSLTPRNNQVKIICSWLSHCWPWTPKSVVRLAVHKEKTTPNSLCLIRMALQYNGKEKHLRSKILKTFVRHLVCHFLYMMQICWKWVQGL